MRVRAVKARKVGSSVALRGGVWNGSHGDSRGSRLGKSSWGRDRHRQGSLGGARGVREVR